MNPTRSSSIRPRFPGRASPGILRALLPLLAVSVAAGLDLTTFRTSYQHEKRLDWTVQFGGGLEEERLNRLTDTTDLRRSWLALEPELIFNDQTRSDILDWNAVIRGLPSVDLRSDNYSGAIASYSLSVATVLDRLSYPGRSDFFIRTYLTARGGVEERTEDDSSGSRRQTATKLDGEIKLKLGVGYGRVRDAWPLLKAARIAEILRTEGVLLHEPDSAELAELASFLSRSWRFAFDHDRPDKFYYDSLTVRLHELGIIAGALPARSLFRLDDQLFVGSYERPFGWKLSIFANPGAMGSIEWGKDSQILPFTRRSGYPLMELGAEGEYDRPFGLDWLATAGFTYRLRPNVLAGTAERQEIHRASADISVSWQVFDRAELIGGVEAEVEHRQYRGGQTEPKTDLSGSCRVGAQYFLTRLLSLHAVLTSDAGRIWPPKHGQWRRSTDFSAGFELGRTVWSRYRT